MDDQLDPNQNQPPQNYQPGQQVTPPQQAYPPQQPYPQQQYPQQPVQPQYQQPYPQQPYQQPAYAPAQSNDQQIQQVVESSSLNFKKLAIFGGIFIIGAIIITVVVSLFGGVTSSIPLADIEDEKLTFNVRLPEGWNANISSVSSFNVVNATPIDELDGDDTAISMSHAITPVEKEKFVLDTDQEVVDLSSREFQTAFDIDISQLTFEPYLTDDDSAFRIAYLQTDNGSKIEHVVERYYLYQSDGTVISARFAYSENYLDVAGAIEAVLDSYSLK